MLTFAALNEYIINVSAVEELQMLSDVAGLERLFAKAQSTIVQGGTVVLVRQNADGSTYKFDAITSEADLLTYKEAVCKYL